MQDVLKSVDRPVLIAFGFIIVMLLAGSLYSSSFLSATYLLQQLQVAAFLGIIASGLMLVILLGHIDLSVPWIVTVGGMMSTAAAGWWGETGVALAIPFGMLCGLAFGLFNGLCVTKLRMPPFVPTLATMSIARALALVVTRGKSIDEFRPYDDPFFALGGIFAVVGVAALVAWVGFVVCFSAALSGVFQLALYRYAVDGRVPGFDEDLMRNAFRPRGDRGGWLN